MTNADLICHLINLLLQQEKDLNQLATEKVEERKSNVKKQDEA